MGYLNFFYGLYHLSYCDSVIAMCTLVRYEWPDYIYRCYSLLAEGLINSLVDIPNAHIFLLTLYVGVCWWQKIGFFACCHLGVLENLDSLLY